MMAPVQNFPFAAILLYLTGGVLCSVLPGNAAKRYCLVLNGAVTLMMAAVLAYTIRTGTSYVYTMGHFPAPWGNEIRVGVLEALLASSFSLILLLSLFGGMEHILEDVEEGKTNLYFTVICLLMSSLMALIFTNDLFTGYVFVEINTMASCALVMLRARSGRTLVATIHYLVLSLLGSGMFLIGISLLYDLTGHLLMENIAGAVQQLFASGDYQFPLTVIVGFFAIGLATKSALWPFGFWLPAAHGDATASSSAVLSGLVLKGYIILLIKIFYRVIGLNVIATDKVCNILFLFAVVASLSGSVRAIRERDLKRVLACSSLAQIGYIYLGIGLGSRAGMVAAFVQILVHAVTKSMLFITAGGFMSVSGGSKRLHDLAGAGRRDPLGGAAFAVGALSMIGIPLFAGFATKLYLVEAAVKIMPLRPLPGITAVGTLILSTLLNALYYIPILLTLFARPEEGQERSVKREYRADYVVSLLVFMALNVALGLAFPRIVGLIETGLDMFG